MTCAFGIFQLPLLIAALVLIQGSTANVNDNGQITWASIPGGESYNEVKFDGGKFPLTTTWNSIDNFLKVVSPGDPPYDVIRDFIGGEVDTDNLVDNYSQFQDNLLGFFIAFGIGVIFIVVFPIVTICFCCCRCCGNCGGKMEQKSTSRCKCTVFGLILLVCCAFILGGVGTAYTLNSYTTDAVKSFPNDVISNIENIQIYVNNTNNELQFLIVQQLVYTLDQLKLDLNAIDTLVGVPVRDQLNVIVGPAITAIKDLATIIDTTNTNLLDVNSTQDELAALYETFVNTIATVKAEFTTECTNCACCNMGGFPNYVNFVSNVDYRDLGVGNGQFPQVAIDEALMEMQDLVDEDLMSTAEEGEQTFLDIPETLKNSTQSDLDSISDNVDGFEDDIQEAVDELSNQLDDIAEQFDGYESDINDIGDEAEHYDQYRVYAMTVLFGIILLVAVIWLIGMVLGIIGYDRDATPSQRGCLSNCGGCLLMLGASIVFIFATIFMLITSVTFIVGGPLDRLFCDPFQSYDAFKQTIDLKDGIPNTPGYYLGDVLLNDSSIPLTASGALESCENNDAIYEALYLVYISNISEYLDYKQYMPDIDSQFENISGDFSNINILPDSGRDTLENFGNSSVDSIDFAMFKLELQKDVTNDGNNPNDLSVSVGLITTYITTHTTLTSNEETTLNGLKDSLNNLQNDVIVPMITKRDELLAKLNTLETSTAQIDPSINATLFTADAAQNEIDNSIDSLVSQVVTGFSDRVLGYAEQYVNYIDIQVTTEVGRCSPIFLLYDDSLNLICKSLLQSWNSLWFCLGWCLFFLMFGLIFSIKLAKYYRKMQSDHDDMMTIEMTQKHSGNVNANKIHPHPGYR